MDLRINDEKLREAVKAIKRISDLIQASNALMDNPQMDNGHVARLGEFLREMKAIRHSAYQGIGIIEACLNTPKNWPEKKEVNLVPINQQGVVIGFYEKDGKDSDVGYNRAIDECKKAAMKGCPCCGVARIIEKRAEVPTVARCWMCEKDKDDVICICKKCLDVMEKSESRMAGMVAKLFKDRQDFLNVLKNNPQILRDM